MNAKKIYTIDEIKKKVSPVAQKYKIERVYLFGSYARGDADSSSDIDLRIDGKLNFGFIKYYGMCDDLQKQFRRQLDLTTTGGLDESFLKEIEKYEVLVYGN